MVFLCCCCCCDSRVVEEESWTGLQVEISMERYCMLTVKYINKVTTSGATFQHLPVSLAVSATPRTRAPCAIYIYFIIISLSKKVVYFLFDIMVPVVQLLTVFVVLTINHQNQLIFSLLVWKLNNKNEDIFSPRYILLIIIFEKKQ